MSRRNTRQVYLSTQDPKLQTFIESLPRLKRSTVVSRIVAKEIKEKEMSQTFNIRVYINYREGRAELYLNEKRKKLWRDLPPELEEETILEETLEEAIVDIIDNIVD